VCAADAAFRAIPALPQLLHMPEYVITATDSAFTRRLLAATDKVVKSACFRRSIGASGLRRCSRMRVLAHIKAADTGAAYREATRLAGFLEAEARLCSVAAGRDPCRP